MHASNNMPYDVSAHLDKIARFYPIVRLCQNSGQLYTVSITEELLMSVYIKYTEETQQFIDALNAEAIDRLNSIHDNDGDDEAMELLQMNNRQSEVFCLEDFHQAVGHLYRALKCAVSTPISRQTLEILTQQFENQLDDLTDFIAQLPTAIRSPLFSLGRYLETLEKNYEHQYDKVYWATAYFRRHWTFFRFRHPERGWREKMMILIVMKISRLELLHRVIVHTMKRLRNILLVKQ